MTNKISLEALKGGSKKPAKKVSCKKKRTSKTTVMHKADKPPARSSKGGKWVAESEKRAIAHDYALNLINCGLNKVSAYKETVECAGLGQEAIWKRVQRLYEQPEAVEIIRQVLNEFGSQSSDLRGAVKAELIHQMNTNILDLYDDDGIRLPMAELKSLPLWFQRSIKEIGTRENIWTTKDGREFRTLTHYAKLYDKQKAGELLAKIEGWVKDNEAGSSLALSLATLVAGGSNLSPPRKGIDIDGFAEAVD